MLRLEGGLRRTSAVRSTLCVSIIRSALRRAAVVSASGLLRRLLLIKGASPWSAEHGAGNNARTSDTASAREHAEEEEYSEEA